MEIDELSRAMRDGELVTYGTVPDLDTLRSGGRRRRRNHRLLTGAVAALLAGVVTAGALAASSRSDRAEEPVGPDHGPALSAYEKRVLRELPGSYAVEGTVVSPARPDPTHTQNLANVVSGFSGGLTPLGWHGMWDADERPLYSRPPLPEFMRRPPPEGAQVFFDTGPLRIGCRPASGGRHCRLFLVVGDRRTGWLLFSNPLGDDGFLQPGEPMELIPGGTLENHVHQPTVIGGMHGVRTTRVVLTLEDGTTAEAVVDSGRISSGDTIFWALLDSPPVRATAYDAAGEVVEDHRRTPCDDPLDCSTR